MAHTEQMLTAVRGPDGAAQGADRGFRDEVRESVAAAVRFGPELRAAVAEAALDQIGAGVALIEAGGGVIFANRTAEALLGGPEVAAAVDALRQRGEGANASEPHRVVTATSTIDIRVASIGGTVETVAAVFLSDLGAQAERRRDALCRRYGLTPAESRLAAEIAKGDGRSAAARRCGISPATARAHLSSIFEKTGTHRQAELVRLLLTQA